MTHSADRRRMEVLHSIVRSFIETGEPVASRSVSRQHPDTLSPATIRNVMMDLAEEGFLEQPHASAGRIPTAKAFTAYVQALPFRKASFSEVQLMRVRLNQSAPFKERVEGSSSLLTELPAGR